VHESPYIARIAAEREAAAREEEEGQAEAATQLQYRRLPFYFFVVMAASDRDRTFLHHDDRSNYGNRSRYWSSCDDRRSGIMRYRDRTYGHPFPLCVLRGFSVVCGRRGRGIHRGGGVGGRLLWLS